MARYVVLFLALYPGLFAQPAAVGRGGHKTFLTVPMVGTGSWEDPKRPAFLKESGISFRYQVSDDGTMAIVEAAPRNLAELKKLADFVGNEPRARLFRPDKDAQADVIAEFKKPKRDFDPPSLSRPSPPVALPPAAAN